MSGVFGWFALGGGAEAPPPESLFRALAARTAFSPEAADAHRSFAAPGVALGTVGGPHRLDSVAFVNRAGQPVALAFAGNLYERSAGAGPEASIAEGLLDRYLRAGVEFLRDLRGDFTVAVWDGARDVLIVATDPFRIRPLFYARSGSRLAFSSRLRALAAPEVGIPLSIEPRAIVEVVSSSYVATPRTIYREARKLAPGHFLEATRTEVRERAYWNLDFLHPDSASEGKLKERTRASFADAVASRLAVDPGGERIGAFLSGGIDSSTVTGVMTRIAGSAIPSFSIGFGEARYNEISYARIVARAFGSTHREYFVTPADALRALPILVDSFDEPFANASAIPAYYCARLAAEHGVEVLYAGDGGDELFAGNERYATDRIYDFYRGVPVALRRLAIEPGVALLARTGFPLARKAKRYIEGATVPYPDRLTTYGFFRHVPIADFFRPEFLASIEGEPDPYEAMSRHWAQAPAGTVLDRQLYIDLKLAVSDNDLFKVTRMAEAAGIAVRYPFLDRPFAELAARIPASLKMRGRELRTFFKETYADLLPPETRAKRKHGFGLPISGWLLTDPALNERMRDLLLSPESGLRAHIRPEMLEELVRRHAADATPFYGAIVWNLVMLELWQRGAR